MLQLSEVCGVWYVTRIWSVWYLVAAVVVPRAHVCVLRFVWCFQFSQTSFSLYPVVLYFSLISLVINTITYAFFFLAISLPISSLQIARTWTELPNAIQGFDLKLRKCGLDNSRFLRYFNFSEVFCWIVLRDAVACSWFGSIWSLIYEMSQ